MFSRYPTQPTTMQIIHHRNWWYCGYASMPRLYLKTILKIVENFFDCWSDCISSSKCLILFNGTEWKFHSFENIETTARIRVFVLVVVRDVPQYVIHWNKVLPIEEELRTFLSLFPSQTVPHFSIHLYDLWFAVHCSVCSYAVLDKWMKILFVLFMVECACGRLFPLFSYFYKLALSLCYCTIEIKIQIIWFNKFLVHEQRQCAERRVQHKPAVIDVRCHLNNPTKRKKEWNLARKALLETVYNFLYCACYCCD